MRVFRRRSKNALLAKSLQHGFPPFAFRKEKLLQAAQEQTFILWNCKLSYRFARFFHLCSGRNRKQLSCPQRNLLFDCCYFFHKANGQCSGKPCSASNGTDVEVVRKSVVLWIFLCTERFQLLIKRCSADADHIECRAARYFVLSVQFIHRSPLLHRFCTQKARAFLPRALSGVYVFSFFVR